MFDVIASVLMIGYWITSNSVLQLYYYNSSNYNKYCYNQYQIETLISAVCFFWKQELQAEVLSYRSTWAVMWLWKVSSADAFLQFTILAILFDKLWVRSMLLELECDFPYAWWPIAWWASKRWNPLCWLKHLLALGCGTLLSLHTAKALCFEAKIFT